MYFSTVITNNLSQTKVKTIQEQLVAEISKTYSDAEAKKVDKDNFLDIHIPSINSKRGTHLFFNTGKNEIKIGFYCRDEDFNNDILSRSSHIEAYAQGVRIKNNPAFTTVSEAISAALNFLSELRGEKKQTKASKPKESNLKNLVSAFNDKLVNGGLDDQMMGELDALTIPGSLLLYEISKENLQKSFDTEIVTNDDFDLTKFIELGDWDELIEIIGDEEVTKNKEEYASETIYSNGCILLLYCEGEYIYSFMSPGEEGADEEDEKVETNYSEFDINRIALENIELVKDHSKELYKYLKTENEHLYFEDNCIIVSACLDRQNMDIAPDKATKIIEDLESYMEEGISNFVNPFNIEYGTFNDSIQIKTYIYDGVEVTSGCSDIYDLFDKSVDDFDSEEEYEKAANEFVDEMWYQNIKIGIVPPELTENLISSNSFDINLEDFDLSDDSELDEINLADFDLDDAELISKVNKKVKEENTLTELIYVNNALKENGFEIDNHNPFFFTSMVNVSDKELNGFLYVNMDGFHSNCVEENEMQMIFSWDSVKNIEIVEEDESSIKINIIAEEGILSITEPYSKNLLILHSLYKNIWKKVVERFVGQNAIMWDIVENEMGISRIVFESHDDYKNWITGENNAYEIIETSVPELRKDINRRKLSNDTVVEIIAYHKTRTEFDEDYTFTINNQEIWLTISRWYEDSNWKTQIDNEDLSNLLNCIETDGFQAGLDSLFGWEFNSPGKGDNGFEISLKEGDIKLLPKECLEDGEVNPYFIFENYASNLEDIDVTLRGETDRLDIIINEEYFGSIWQGAYPS